MGLGQDLEAVADPEDMAAVGGEPGHGPHDGAEPRDHAGSQVVAVREPSRQEDAGDAVQGDLVVPQEDRRGTGHLEGVDGVDVAVRAREYDDADPDRHARAPDMIDEDAPIASIS
jgi:hypothetical protein